VAKQYRQWIELETQYPAGARFVPTFDKKGNPISYWTRGVSGEKISIPMLQEVGQDWYEGGIATVRALYDKPSMVYRGVNLSKVRNIPKGVAEQVEEWLRANPDNVLYGGIVDYTQTAKGRIPVDLDLFSPNPSKTVKELVGILKNAGIPVKVEDGKFIKVFKDKLWRKAFDVHSIAEQELPFGLGQPRIITIDGISVTSAGSQLANKFDECLKVWAENPVRFKYLAEELLKYGTPATEAELEKFIGGIGAKPLTAGQITALKVRDVYNTIRDIFIKDFSVSRKLGIAAALDSDSLLDVQAMLASQARLSRIAQQWRTATPSLAARLKPTVDKLAREYTRLAQRTQDRLVERLVSTERVLRVASTERVPVSPQKIRREEPARRKEAIPRISRVGPTVRVGRIQRIPSTRIPTPPPARAPVPPPTTRVVPPHIPIPPYRPIPRPAPPPRVPIPPPKPVPPKPAIEAENRRKRKFPLGSVCWRQGIFWITIYPPYKKENVMYTRKPPRGVSVAKGPKSAYETVTKLGFQVPDRVLHDMGIMDVVITKKGKSIRFKRDIKQKTKLGYAEGVPPGIKMGQLG